MAMSQTKSEIVPYSREQYEQDLQTIFEGIPVEMEDSEEAQRRIAESILQASSLGEVFATRSTTATKDVVGRDLVIRDFMLREGEIDGRLGNYMLIDAADLHTGEVLLLNTSAPNIMATLLWVKHHGKLPIECAVVKVGRAKRGKNAPLGLEPRGRTAEELSAEQAAK